jgi:excinuclease ABC subunit C
VKSQEFKKLNIPKNPGVYFFKKDNEILYIGKATSLKDRVGSYFGADLISTRGPALLDMVTQSKNIEWIETDSVLEALILEAELIKKHQPKYNTKEKDNKSFYMVGITDDVLPRVIMIRARNITLKDEIKKLNIKYTFGPYPNGGALRDAMKIIRRIFPYIDGDSLKKDNQEFYRQLGLTPDTRENTVNEAYQENIKHIRDFFAGKKKKILVELEKKMYSAAKEQKFERASLIKKQIFALTHINDVALMKKEYFDVNIGNSARIESYDIAHMSGKNMVGVMTVVLGSQKAPNEYKKFIIRGNSGADDTKALREILERRFNHEEWGIPNVVVIDGGQAQINVGQQVLKELGKNIPVVSVLKDERHKPKDILGDKGIVEKYKEQILLSNAEAHRFAISFHREKRGKNFLTP